MSGRSAKAARRAERERLDECVRQAHDQLHRDDVDACHELLHEALGQGEADVERVAPLAGLAQFDLAFRRLCLNHGVRAGYVAIDGERDSDGAARLVSGGDGTLVALVDRAVRREVAG